MQDSSIERVMFSAFKARLQYDSLEYKVILYSDNKGYEYNLKTHEIRPFTSMLWFDLNGKGFDFFIEYFDIKCRGIIKEFENSGYVSESIPYGIGYFENGTIVIDIDSLNGLLPGDKEYEELSNIIKNEFNNAIKYIFDLYNKSENVLKDTIKNLSDK